jgi:hypothetical protein
MKKFISFTLTLLLLVSLFTLAVSANEPNLFDENSKATGEMWEADFQYDPNCIFEDYLNFDDKFETRWVADRGDNPAVLLIDIGSVKTFNRLSLVEARDRISTWLLEVSVDGTTWTRVANGDGLENSVPDYDLDGVIEQYYSHINFDTVEGKYLRLSLDTADPQNLAVSLWRAELYNIGNVSLAAVETPAEEPAENLGTGGGEEAAVALSEPVSPVSPPTADPITLIAVGSLISAAGAVIIARKRK